MNPVVEESLSPLDLRITISNKNSIFVVEIEGMERTLLLLAIGKVLLLQPRLQINLMQCSHINLM